MSPDDDTPDVVPETPEPNAAEPDATEPEDAEPAADEPVAEEPPADEPVAEDDGEPTLAVPATAAAATTAGGAIVPPPPAAPSRRPIVYAAIVIAALVAATLMTLHNRNTATKTIAAAVTTTSEATTSTTFGTVLTIPASPSTTLSIPTVTTPVTTPATTRVTTATTLATSIDNRPLSIEVSWPNSSAVGEDVQFNVKVADPDASPIHEGCGGSSSAVAFGDGDSAPSCAPRCSHPSATGTQQPSSATYTYHHRYGAPGSYVAVFSYSSSACPNPYASANQLRVRVEITQP